MGPSERTRGTDTAASPGAQGPRRFAILCTEADWMGPPRLARALARGGAQVCMVAPPQSLAASTRYKASGVFLPREQITASLGAIVATVAERFAPHSILAGDDAAFGLLARLLEHKDSLSDDARALLGRSLPDKALAAIVAVDSQFVADRASASAGGNGANGWASPPASVPNPSWDDCRAFAAAIGFPILVKRDGLFAGIGVTLCSDERSLEIAVNAACEAPPTFAGTGFVVQKYVAGPIYGVSIVGREGRAIDGFSFLKERTYPAPYGPTALAKVERRDDLLDTAIGIFGHYGMNGFCGFDFVVGENGTAYLLEINPRITPTSGLGVHFGVDLVGALLARDGEAPSTWRSVPEAAFVPLFPNEWLRDPDSESLRLPSHDVPWDDPQVIRAFLR